MSKPVQTPRVAAWISTVVAATAFEAMSRLTRSLSIVSNGMRVWLARTAASSLRSLMSMWTPVSSRNASMALRVSVGAWSLLSFRPSASTSRTLTCVRLNGSRTGAGRAAGVGRADAAAG